jgi:hypothetical protein
VKVDLIVLVEVARGRKVRVGDGIVARTVGVLVLVFCLPGVDITGLVCVGEGD